MTKTRWIKNTNCMTEETVHNEIIIYLEALLLTSLTLIARPDRLINNWILMSWQTHRVSSGQSNSEMHISKLFSYKPFVKSIHQTSHFANKQNTYAQTSGTNFRKVSPFSITPVKRVHKARTSGNRLLAEKRQDRKSKPVLPENVRAVFTLRCLYIYFFFLPSLR